MAIILKCQGLDPNPSIIYGNSFRLSFDRNVSKRRTNAKALVNKSSGRNNRASDACVGQSQAICSVTLAALWLLACQYFGHGLRRMNIVGVDPINWTLYEMSSFGCDLYLLWKSFTSTFLPSFAYSVINSKSTVVDILEPSFLPSISLPHSAFVPILSDHQIIQ